MSYKKYAKMLKIADKEIVKDVPPNPYLPEGSSHAKELVEYLGPSLPDMVNRFSEFIEKVKSGPYFILMTPFIQYDQAWPHPVLFDPNDLLEKTYKKSAEGGTAKTVYVTREGEEFFGDDLEAVERWSPMIPGLIWESPMQSGAVIFRIPKGTKKDEL